MVCVPLPSQSPIRGIHPGAPNANGAMLGAPTPLLFLRYQVPVVGSNTPTELRANVGVAGGGGGGGEGGGGVVVLAVVGVQHLVQGDDVATGAGRLAHVEGGGAVGVRVIGQDREGEGGRRRLGSAVVGQQDALTQVQAGAEAVVRDGTLG